MATSSWCRRRLSLVLMILAGLGVALGSGGAGASIQRPADIRTTVTIGGPAVIVTLGSGAKAYLTFSGSSGQNLGLGLTGSSIACCGATVKLLNPSGTQIGSVGFATSPADWNLPKLTTTGTYTLLVDPGTKTGSVTLTLSKDIVGGSIAVGGASVTATIARAGQNERFTFSATSGQYLGIGLTSNSFACCTASVKLLSPSGTLISSIGFATSPLDWNLPVLTASGTYTLLVDPGALTGSVTLTLSQDIAGGTIVAGGASVTATFSRVGQNERLTFSGTAGENLGLGLTGSIPCCANNWVRLINPSGTQIGAVIFGPDPRDWNLPTLTAAGTYTLLVDPGPNMGSVTLTFSDDLVGTIVPGGNPVTATFARAGQNERLTFAGTAGEKLGLGLTGTTFPCCINNYVRLLDPVGTQIASVIFGGSGADWNPPTLTVSGTYTLLVDPGPNTGSTTLTLSDDFVQPMSIGGSPATLTLRVGQNARFAFAGSSGQTVSFSLSKNSIPSFQVMLLNSGGTQVGGTGFFGSGSVTWAVPTLPASGNYTIFFEPHTSAGTASFSLTLAGAPVNISKPAVSGILEDGEIVTASPGTWANAPTSFSYQWQRCIDATCSDIAGAGQNVYTLVDDDINSTMKVIVGAANSSGSTTDTSPQTALPVRIKKFSHSTSACSTEDYEDPINFLVDYPRVIWTAIPVAGPPFPTFDYTSGPTGGRAVAAIARNNWYDGAGSSSSWVEYRYNGTCVDQDDYATNSSIPGSGSHVRFWISTQGRRPVGATHRDYPCKDLPSPLYFKHGSNDYVESAIELADFFYNFVDENGYQARPTVAVYRDREPTPEIWSCDRSSPDDGFTQEIDYRGTDILHVFGP